MNGAAGTFVALLSVSVAFPSSAAVLLDDEAYKYFLFACFVYTRSAL